MRSAAFHHGRALRILALACLALALAAEPALSSSTPGKPSASTGGVTHVRGTSAQLQATVNPNGNETTYHFEYGPTVAYGSQTAPAPVGSGTKAVKVGQPVTGFLVGFHYRVVAVNGVATTFGKDKTYTGGKLARLRFHLPKGKPTEREVGYQGAFTLTGTLTGTGSSNHPIALQVVPYPFKAPFTQLSAPVLTTAAGAFTFNVAGLTTSTEMRLVTLDPRPVYSSVMTVYVAPRVTVHVRAGAHTGLVRVYGTVTPFGKLGAPVTVQLLKPAKPNSKREEGPRPQAVGGTVLKRATATTARFSAVVNVRSTGYYRVYVKLPKGALVSAYSRDIFIRAPHLAAKGKKKAKKKG